MRTKRDRENCREIKDENHLLQMRNHYRSPRVAARYETVF